MIHVLKIRPEFYGPIKDGLKLFEIRHNDRGFKTGDVLALYEYDGAQYTGRLLIVRVTYMITAREFPEGIKPGYCVLGIKMRGDRSS